MGEVDLFNRLISYCYMNKVNKMKLNDDKAWYRFCTG